MIKRLNDGLEGNGENENPGSLSGNNLPKLERLYSRLGQALYDKIRQKGKVEIDSSIALLVKNIAVLRKDLGHLELERRIDRRFERIENQLEQLTDLIRKRIPLEPELSQPEEPAEKSDKPADSPISEDLLGKKPVSPPEDPESGRLPPSVGDRLDQPPFDGETEEKARAKARALAQAEAKARMEIRDENRAAAKGETDGKTSPEVVDKIRQSIKDLQALVKSREDKIQESKQELNGIAEAGGKPAAEAVKPSVVLEKPTEIKKDSEEAVLPEEKPSEIKAGSLEQKQPEAEKEDWDFSSHGRIDETRLFMELAPQIPDSADRLSYLEFLRDLQSGSPTSRIVAAGGLIKWPIPQTEISLISAWKREKESQVRAQIIESLKTIESSRIMGVFREFQAKSDPRAQLMALEGLNRWGGGEGIRHILEGLRSDHPMVRRRAVTYIGWSMYKKALPNLVRLLRDPSLYVRKTTVAVVISFRESSSVFFLLDALNDEAESIRTQVFKTLMNMTGQDFGYQPAARQSQRLETIVAWKKWWRENEHSFRLFPPGSTLEKSAPPKRKRPESPAKEKSMEEPKTLAAKPLEKAGKAEKAGPKRDKPKADKEERPAGKAIWQPLPEGSLEQRMYEVLSRKSSEGMTIQDMGSSLNLPWQKLIQKTGLLQKSGRIYKDRHLFFPILRDR